MNTSALRCRPGDRLGAQLPLWHVVAAADVCTTAEAAERWDVARKHRAAMLVAEGNRQNPGRQSRRLGEGRGMLATLGVQRQIRGELAWPGRAPAVLTA